MSDQDLDKLFRSKLEDMRKAPSPGAWDRIHEQLEGKRPAFAWMRIAAALLLLFMAGAVAWLTIGPGAEPEITASADNVTDTVNTTGSVQPEEPDPLQREQPLANAGQQESGEVTIAETRPRSATEETPSVKKAVKQLSPRPAETGTTDESLIAVHDQPVQLTEKSEEPQKSPSIAETGKIKTEGNTLRFSIDEFEDAERTVAMATETQESDEEGLKKIWGLLRQVKEPETGLGELRDLKNNILAFGKDKKESD